MEALSCRAGGRSGQWTAFWRIQNSDGHPLEIKSVWLPHDRFYSGRHTFDPSLKLGPKEAADLQLLVECQEPAGSVVENAFVILQLVRLGQP